MQAMSIQSRLGGEDFPIVKGAQCGGCDLAHIYIIIVVQ